MPLARAADGADRACLTRCDRDTAVAPARADLGYSQEPFAYAVVIHRTYMGAVERGERKVSLGNMIRISNPLKVPLSRLIAEAENESTACEGRG